MKDTFKIDDLDKFKHLSKRWQSAITAKMLIGNDNLIETISMFLELQCNINNELGFLDNCLEKLSNRCKLYTKHKEVKTYLDELTGNIVYKLVDDDEDFNTLKSGYLSTINLIKIFGTDFYEFLITNKFRTAPILKLSKKDVISFMYISDYVYINDIKYKCRDGSKCEDLDLNLHYLDLKSYCPDTRTLKLLK